MNILQASDWRPQTADCGQRKFKITNSKFQTNSKFKIQNLPWNLELVIWNAREARFPKG